MALEHHVQVHEDPLVLLLIPRAPHLLHERPGEPQHAGGGVEWGLVLGAGLRPGGAHLDRDDVARLPEAHLPHLATRAAAHLPQVLQIIDFGLVALARTARAGGWARPRHRPHPKT